MNQLSELESTVFLEKHGASCWDCLADYDTFPDTILEDELWELINPSAWKGSGILCPTCIINRLVELHKKDAIPSHLLCPIRLDIYIG